MCADKDDAAPPQGSNNYDRLVAVIRSVVGVVPIVGPLLTEIATEIIPNQRMDRLERYLMALEQRLAALSTEMASVLKADKAAIALFEDGAIQASRAITEERLEQIANIVAAGLSDEQREYLRWRRILDIFQQIDDEQVAILTAYATSLPGQTFKNLEKLRPQQAYIGADKKILEASAFWEASMDKLEGLGLLHFNAKTEKLDTFKAVLVVDSFGNREGYRTISQLGRSVLAAAGVDEDS